MLDAISHITVGVANLSVAIELWVDRFGLELVSRQTGPDPGLAGLWDIPPGQIVDQALVRTPGTTAGWMHFVEFENPDLPVRLGASTADLGPKSLDVYCANIRRRYDELNAAGFQFRSRVVDYSVDDIHVSEVQMLGHDETNIAFVEQPGEKLNLSAEGFGAVTSFVIIVADMAAEIEFYATVLQLDTLMRHEISGADIEEVVNLPTNAVLEMCMLGRETQRFGRVELIQYKGLAGLDRFPLAKAPALGALHCSFLTHAPDEVMARAEQSGFAGRVVDAVETMFSSGPVGILFSPAGFRLEVFGATAQ
jgi:catechol 2,3-dioxygenase-like lactoylglutathione lyase family enzyme